VAATPPGPVTGAEQPLTGLSVVVCRAVADAESLLERLQSVGAEPVSVPLHQRDAPSDDGQALRRAIEAIDSYDWLVVTSANGVRAVLAELGDRALPASLHVAAVGPATTAAFTDAGVEVDVVPPRATAADLAASLPPARAGEVVLVPLNEAADDTLECGLEARGYAVDRVDAYRMTEPQPPPGEHEAVAAADAVLFTAPSIVDRFCDRFGEAAVPDVVVCIGPSTGERARDRGLDRLVVATTSSEEGLIEALLATLGSTGRPSRDRPSPVHGIEAGSGSSDDPESRTADRGSQR